MIYIWPLYSPELGNIISGAKRGRGKYQPGLCLASEGPARWAAGKNLLQITVLVRSLTVAGGMSPTSLA